MPKSKSDRILQATDVRDLRDSLVRDAIESAIVLIDDAELPKLAASVLRLARDKLEAVDEAQADG